MAPLGDTERRDFREICDRRDQVHSTLLTRPLPQLPGTRKIGDPTVAESILDKLVHNTRTASS
jgi:hypothetical protein